jgi:hypothetical protein
MEAGLLHCPVCVNATAMLAHAANAAGIRWGGIQSCRPITPSQQQGIEVGANMFTQGLVKHTRLAQCV